MELELCATRLAEVRLARDAGLDRVELCAALEMGGLTPSWALIGASVAFQGPEIHVMLRPRGGSFTYSPEEVELMRRDMLKTAELGAVGVVLGVLTARGEIDLPACQILLDQAGYLGLECTFHRAFDLLEDPEKGMEQLIELGFDRILTSGGQPMAIQGLSRIREMVGQTQGRIQVMAGSGIRDSNAPLFAAAGVDALHFSARKALEKETGLGMGKDYLPDREKVEQIQKALLLKA